MNTKLFEEYIILAFMVRQEGEYFISECMELGTSSFGLDEGEAFENLQEATEVYLETLVDLGEARQVLKKKGVQVFLHEPASLNLRRARFPADSTIRPTCMKISSVKPDKSEGQEKE